MKTEDDKYNKKQAIELLARDILRNGSPLMTMLEALKEAEKQYNKAQGVK